MAKIQIEKPTIEGIDKEAIKASMKRAKKSMKRQKSPAGHEAPDFWAMLDDPDIGDPFGDLMEDLDGQGIDLGNLGLEEASDLSVEVMSDTLRRIIEEKRERKAKYQLLTDASYCVVVVFQTTDQKEEFMKQAGWMDLQDNSEGIFINGLELADMMGIPIETIYIPTKEAPTAPVALRDKKIIIGGE